jgi:hypothetical protein
MNSVKDEQVEFTGMAIHKHILFCGSTGSGKSVSLMNYIYLSALPRRGTYKNIFFVYKTEESLYKYLKSELKEKILFIRGLEHLPECQEFEDGSADNTDSYLVIFDDCINDRDKSAVKKVNDYFTFGRKKNITLCFLTQSYFQTNIFIRQQVSFVILNGIKNSGDLTRILKDYAVGDISKEQMNRMYEYCKEEREEDEINFMKICTYQCAKDKKFSRNFLDYLNPDDFK